MPKRTETLMEARQRERPVWPGLTLEAVLYALLVLGAAFMRFYDLGRWPLRTEEATQALAAWRFLHAQPAGSGAVPLLFDGALLGFFAFGASDTVARALPALLGTALVLLPLALRSRLGSWGTLAATFLLAFSPSLVFYSRTLAGAVPALAGLGALLGALELVRRERWREARAAAVGGLAVALTASAWSYTFILAALAFVGLGWAASRRGQPWPGWPALQKALRPALSDRRAWVGLGLAVVPLSTALFLNLRGLQGTVDLLGEWLARLLPGGGGRAWLYPLGLLVYYETGALVLGVAGLAVGLRRRDPWAGFLGGWAALAVVQAGAFGAPDPAPVAFALLPLSLLAGLAVSEIASSLRPAQGAWVASCLFVLSALAGFWWLQLVAYTNPVASATLGESEEYVRALVLLVPLFLLAAIAVFWYWVGREETSWAVVLLGLGLLACLAVRMSVRVGFTHARDPREPLVVRPSAVDLKDMVRFLEDWSVRKEGDQHALTVAVDESLSPLVPWYLREFPAPAATAAAGAIVVRSEPARPALAGYVGQRFRLRSWSDAPLGSGQNAVAWWLLGTGGGVVQAETLELWIKP